MGRWQRKLERLHDDETNWAELFAVGKSLAV
jgi:hypothetical protein